MLSITLIMGPVTMDPTLVLGQTLATGATGAQSMGVIIGNK